jgi:hypothetical protein
MDLKDFSTPVIRYIQREELQLMEVSNGDGT